MVQWSYPKLSSSMNNIYFYVTQLLPKQHTKKVQAQLYLLDIEDQGSLPENKVAIIQWYTDRYKEELFWHNDDTLYHSFTYASPYSEHHKNGKEPIPGIYKTTPQEIEKILAGKIFIYR